MRKLSTGQKIGLGLAATTAAAVGINAIIDHNRESTPDSAIAVGQERGSEKAVAMERSAMESPAKGSLIFDGVRSTHIMPPEFQGMLSIGALKNGYNGTSLYFDMPVSVTFSRGVSDSYLGKEPLTILTLQFEDKHNKEHTLQIETPEIVTEEEMSEFRFAADGGNLELWLPRDDQPRYVFSTLDGNKEIASLDVWRNGPIFSIEDKTSVREVFESNDGDDLPGFIGNYESYFEDERVQDVLARGGIMVDASRGDVYIPVGGNTKNSIEVHSTTVTDNVIKTEVGVTVRDKSRAVGYVVEVEGLTQEDMAFLEEAPLVVILKDNDEIGLQFFDGDPMELRGTLVKQSHNLRQPEASNTLPLTERIAGKKSPRNRNASYQRI